MNPVISKELNIYCDESCHLEHDGHKVMLLGAVWCERDKTSEILQKLKDIKTKHGIKHSFEIKWTKVSPAKIDFYLELIQYFFNNPYLRFRSIVIMDKTKLKHKQYNQDHDTWHYKMYFIMLKAILNPSDRYNIFIDIKDTKSAEKMRKLKEVLCNNMYDFSRDIIKNIQTVHSYEIGILQLTDLLIGAVCYVNRQLRGSEAKLRLIEEIKKLSGYSLSSSTLIKEEKFNLFVWQASEDGCNE